MAVLGGCFGAGLAVTLAGTLYLFGVYNSRPKPWDDKALTVQWNDLRYLVGQDEVVAGFLFQYGIRNNTSRDYRLTKSGITIMERSVFQPQTLEPAVFNLSIGREDGYFLPAQRTSLIELTYEGSCNPSESREVCFDNHTKELHDLVLLDDGLRYQINLPKPQRKKH
jgi:hypothetical protein